MKTSRDVDLKPYSTMRLTARGAELHEPESVEELKALLSELTARGGGFHLLGAGSNVVFAERVETPIVSLMRVDGGMEDLGGGRFRAGCSVRIQKFIRFAQRRGHGGIEYLFSLPASVGGCVYMNAGRGRGTGQAIANSLESVTTLDPATGEIREEAVRAEEFGHHESPYQKRECVLLGATFRLAEQSEEETERKIRERLETSRRNLDAGKPSCGSVFSGGNRLLFRLFRALRVKSGGLAYSGKTSNWIGNRGGGTLGDFRRLTGKMEAAHRLLGQRCRMEIRIFE